MGVEEFVVLDNLNDVSLKRRVRGTSDSSFPFFVSALVQQLSQAINTTGDIMLH